MVLMQDTAEAIFARRVREMRRQTGMTQQQLADFMARTGDGIYRSTIGKIENGDRPVSVNEAVQIAGIFGVPLTEMLTTDTSREVLEARLAVASLRREADRFGEHIRQLEVLQGNTALRLAEAEKRLAELTDHG